MRYTQTIVFGFNCIFPISKDGNARHFWLSGCCSLISFLFLFFCHCIYPYPYPIYSHSLLFILSCFLVFSIVFDFDWLLLCEKVPIFNWKVYHPWNGRSHINHWFLIEQQKLRYFCQIKKNDLVFARSLTHSPTRWLYLFVRVKENGRRAEWSVVLILDKFKHKKWRFRKRIKLKVAVMRG